MDFKRLSYFSSKLSDINLYNLPVYTASMDMSMIAVFTALGIGVTYSF